MNIPEMMHHMPGLRCTGSLEDLEFSVLSRNKFELFLSLSSDVQPNCQMRTNGDMYFEIQGCFICIEQTAQSHLKASMQAVEKKWKVF